MTSRRSPGLTIGQVAKRTGLPAKTIRYYEESGLLEDAERQANGYRVYGEQALQRLRFVKRARDLGFSLVDVKELLALWTDEGRESGEVQQVALRHARRIEEKMAELESLHRVILDLVHRCHGDDRPDCPILEDLAAGPRPEGDSLVEKRAP